MTLEPVHSRLRIRRFLAVLCGISAFAPLGATAAPVALALEVSGEITPPLQAFTEMEAGSSFEIGSGGRMQFLHYPTCQNVVVEGGRLTLTAENFRVSKGKIIEVSRADCPQRLVVASTEESPGVAGVVLRSASDGVLKVAQRPEFLLLGKTGTPFTRGRLMQDKTVLLDTGLENGRIKWPKSLPSLQTGGDYSLHLAGDGVTRVIKLAIGSQTVQKTPAIIQLD